MWRIVVANDKYTDIELKEKYGLRFPEGRAGTILDEPFELGFKCPRDHTHITWSEFREHVWCYECKMDYHYSICPIQRPCWMKAKLWRIMYGNYPNKFNIQKGRVHPYGDCQENGKYHKCER